MSSPFWVSTIVPFRGLMKKKMKIQVFFALKVPLEDQLIAESMMPERSITLSWMRLRSLAKQPISPFLCQLEFLFLKIYHTMFAFNNNLSSLLPLPSKRLVSHLQAALNFTAKTIHFRLKTIAKYFICDLLAIISAIKYLCRAEKKNSIIKCAIFTISLVFLLPFSSPW